MISELQQTNKIVINFVQMSFFFLLENKSMNEIILYKI